MSTTASTNRVPDDALNLEKLLETLKDTRRYFDDMDRLLEPWPHTLYGMPVIEHEERYEPVLRIRDDVPCTDKVRREVNDYLLKTFGTRDVSIIPKSMAYIFDNKIVMRRDDWLALRCAI